MKIAIALLIMVLAIGPAVSRADDHSTPRTIGYMLDHGCSQARAAGRDEAASQDALNTGHLRLHNRLDKKASDLWYACSKETANPYVHDWALCLHDADLWYAANGPDDPWSVLACLQVNELAYATQYDDVRKAALEFKKANCQTAAQ